MLRDHRALVVESQHNRERFEIVFSRFDIRDRLTARYCSVRQVRGNGAGVRVQCRMPNREEVNVNSMDSQMPSDPYAGQQMPPAPPVITSAMMEYLKQTKPWVRFISILGFIGTGFLLLLGLFLVLGASVLSSRFGSAFGGVPAALIGLIYLVLGAFYILPAVFLFRYASGIQKALTVDLMSGVEDALRSQKSFWRFVGVLMLILLILQVIVLVFLILALVLASPASFRP